MKIAVIADCHLNKTVYRGVMDRQYPNLPFRHADFARSFSWMVEQCINEVKPNFIVINGDVFDYFDPSNEIRGFFGAQLGKLMRNKIPVIMITGNHDVCSINHALKATKELGLKSLKVFDEPTSLKMESDGVPYYLHFFPYSLDVEKKKKTIRGEFEDFLKTIPEDKEENSKSFFFGHFPVKGATLNEYSVDSDDVSLEKVKKQFINQNEHHISMSDLDRLNVDYSILGDLHRFQTLGTKNCISMYSGSIERTDFSEVDQPKGFVVFDSEAPEEKGMGQCSFIEYPSCRPMLELTGNALEIRKDFHALDHGKYQEAIVKIVFKGNRDELIDFSLSLEDIKKEIKDKIDPIHLFHVQRVKNEQEEVALEVEKKIVEAGHIGKEDVLRIIQNMIAERIEDSTEQDETTNLMKTIYEEVTGE